MTLRPGDRLAEFQVIRPLGRGGMGIVYLVRDERLGRQVALKAIAPHLADDREFQERFEAEARSAAAIDHPNAVTIYSAGSADGHLFIAMRYVEGTDLRRSLTESGRPSARAAARLIAEVAGALDAAHAAGFVHRDVKPANILLTGAPGKGTAFLTDFGLTRELGSSQVGLTGTGRWLGTLDYVAPEQVGGGRIDARTDIYSLGIVLFEMLTGNTPFKGDEVQKLGAKANADAPPASTLGAPRAFDAVLSRALAREPDRRFRSAGDLGRAALAAAGAETEAPNERSVATGVAAAGVAAAGLNASGREVEVSLRGNRQEARTERLPVQLPVPPPPPRSPAPTAPPPGRRSDAKAVAMVIGALVVAGGLVAGALALAGNDERGTHTVVTRTSPPVARPEDTAAASTQDVGATVNEDPTTVEAPQHAAGEAPGTVFEGADYSVTVPAGWHQEENEEVASDGSYVENVWTSPGGDEALLIDVSPGGAASTSKSVKHIGENVRTEGNLVYSETNGVIRGGVPGSELAYHADGERPERVDFFLNLGESGFGIIASGSDLDTARRRIDQVVSTLQVSER